MTNHADFETDLFGNPVSSQPGLSGGRTRDADLPEPYQPKPEHVRKSLRRLLEQMRAATDGWPWNAAVTRSHRTSSFDYLCARLPDAAEAARWRAELRAEEARICAITGEEPPA